MQLKAFRITNFRSIVDSGWVQLSPDGVTVLVGQNESGKTSVLHALHCALAEQSVSPDDKRIGLPDPVVFFQIKLTAGELNDDLSEFDPNDISGVEYFIKNANELIDLKCEWFEADDPKNQIEFKTSLVNSAEFEICIEKSRNLNLMPSRKFIINTLDSENHVTLTEPLARIDSEKIGKILYDALPFSTFFDADSGLLPNTVDISSNGKPSGSGATAARNFLTIAEIDLPKLVAGDGRYRQNILNRANKKVSDDFTSFWSQLIGETSKLTLKCEFQHYEKSIGEKAGQIYLEFWICDGNTQLYPKQRSLGVRWFVSFYLQLRASEKNNSKSIFLLDEPGANLHAKAQSDVLKLIDKLKTEVPIIYSTHSPEMIEYDKLFRVRAVQRDSNKEDSPTIIIDAHQLGAASTDTLSPVLAAMGSDMSKQAVIKKTRNVLLEEISGFYYLKSFWKLSEIKDTVHFIAATGVNKLPALANMFLGWGLDFLVAVDDDKQGRDVFNQLKKDLFGDNEELSKTRLLKIPDCTSIEEAFSLKDFKHLVLKNDNAPYENGNAEYLKIAHISKPVIAFEFWLEVESGKITKDDFSEESLSKINKITKSIADLLKARTT